jgi:anti-sigma28 factor (negative regulator of flagellin synthesis)
MKIQPLSRLFEALGSASPSSRVDSTQQVQTDQGEAVALSPGLAEGSDASERSRRVAELKTQVQNGTYKPDSQAVAQSVANELFA